MSLLYKLVPVVLLFAFVGGFAWVGYQMYLYTQQLADRGQKHMEKRHISISKQGGMKVQVKQYDHEEYSARTQKHIVDAWNKSTWPEYRSRFWNKEETARQEKLKQEQAAQAAKAAKK